MKSYFLFLGLALSAMPTIRGAAEAKLGGVLRIAIADGFKPTPGEPYTVLASSRITAKFANPRNEVVASDGSRFIIDDSESAVTLILKSSESGQIDPTRTFALTGMERHVYAYPARALRTRDFLYLRNFSPDKWPTGEVKGHNPRYDFSAQPWPTEEGVFSFNIDPSPSKQFLRLHRTDPETKRFADLAFSRHPVEELYDLRTDPCQIDNVASKSEYAETRQRLRRQLEAELI